MLFLLLPILFIKLFSTSFTFFIILLIYYLLFPSHRHTFHSDAFRYQFKNTEKKKKKTFYSEWFCPFCTCALLSLSPVFRIRMNIKSIDTTREKPINQFKHKKKNKSSSSFYRLLSALFYYISIDKFVENVKRFFCFLRFSIPFWCEWRNT